jgi:hypothetical protein
VLRVIRPDLGTANVQGRPFRPTSAIDEAKSAVAPVQDRKFLGYTFWLSSKNGVRCTIALKTSKR